MDLTPLKELIGDFEEKSFAIKKPDGTEGQIIIKALSVGQLYQTVIEAEQHMKRKKKTDETTSQMYQNFCLVAKSVIKPKLSVEFLENEMDYQTYTVILAIVQQVNTISKK